MIPCYLVVDGGGERSAHSPLNPTGLVGWEGIELPTLPCAGSALG